MVETPNHATINKYPQLDVGMLFRLNEINKTKVCFIAKICQRNAMSKTLNILPWIRKYITVLDYFDKHLLVLSATSCGVSIATCTTVIDVPGGITCASLSFMFSISNGIAIKTFENNRKKKEVETQ